MENIELMTNDELKAKKNELATEFENQKTIIAKAYNIMLALKKQNDKIDNLLEKRGGND